MVRSMNAPLLILAEFHPPRKSTNTNQISLRNKQNPFETAEKHKLFVPDY